MPKIKQLAENATHTNRTTSVKKYKFTLYQLNVVSRKEAPLTIKLPNPPSFINLNKEMLSFINKTIYATNSLLQ